MAGSALMPTSLVEITVSCRNLLDTDVFSKSDPICVLLHQPFGTTEWTELKRTECIKNSLNPDFATKIPLTYRFEEQQRLKFQVFDVDFDSPDLADHDFIGDFECTLALLVSSQKLEKPLVNKDYSNAGSIILITEELSSCKEELSIQFVAKGLENNSWFSSLNPFLEFYKANEDGTFTLVHRTEKVANTEHPVWKEFNVKTRSFCNGDYDRNLMVKCMNYKSGGNHKLIGVFYTTVNKLKQGPDSANNYWVINEEKKKRKGSRYKNSGEVLVNKAYVRQVYSFLDYIKGGMEFTAFFGIDFTASNGDPKTPQSLHYINPVNPNQYVSAIQSVGSIIEEYDSDKYFPVLGFGAKMPPDYSVVSHEFFVNGDPSNPHCHRIQGVIEAYCNCVSRVQLYGPTNFAPIINHVARFAASNRAGDKYFVLLILTDGIISDMPQTKEAIVNASTLPMSIIIVGVGSDDFANMEELDGDTVRLCSNNRYAARDIVQFVPYRQFLIAGGSPYAAKEKLAREVIVNASTLPVSIIIVGVGSDDFANMEELDGDKVRLCSNNRYAARDIVQFVPFQQFLMAGGSSYAAKEKLAREVLAEVPDQVIAYMKANNIQPNSPKIADAFLPSEMN
ncbi:copine-8-like isoform X2 [Macrobrachium nipponense]|uniref:copine-8-like isoform X2 n=1 Tax=Macrobrachium nipponense TaxID=159736 RepID=UPI0030C88145